MPLPFIIGAAIAALIIGGVAYAVYKISVYRLTNQKLREIIAEYKGKEGLGPIINEKIEQKDYETIKIKMDDGKKGVEVIIEADEIEI